MKKRNYGIDLLRIISMFLICIFHVMNKCGLPAQSGTITKWHIPFFLQVFTIGAVNIYAIISGYVGLESKFKIKNIFKLYFIVTFYSFFIDLLFLLFFFTLRTEPLDLLKALLPFAFNYYWYYTAYFCMYFFTPFINKLILSLNNRETKRLILLILVFFTIIPTIFKTDLYNEVEGYTVIWITCAYILGACAKKLNLVKKISKKNLLLIYFSLSIASYIFLIATNFLFGKGDSRFISYISPLTTIATLAFVLFFAKLEIHNKKLKKGIALFSASAFSVYLIHTHPIIWRTGILWRVTSPVVSFPKIWIFPGIIICALAIYFTCTFIDFIRAAIFSFISKLFTNKNMIK